jgi:hypothetical protein
MFCTHTFVRVVRNPMKCPRCKLDFWGPKAFSPYKFIYIFTRAERMKQLFGEHYANQYQSQSGLQL